ncbi:unnamed protein product, partial [Gadus morhua 'NCC']
GDLGWKAIEDQETLCFSEACAEKIPGCLAHQGTLSNLSEPADSDHPDLLSSELDEDPLEGNISDLSSFTEQKGGGLQAQYPNIMGLYATTSLASL